MFQNLPVFASWGAGCLFCNVGRETLNWSVVRVMATVRGAGGHGQCREKVE